MHPFASLKGTSHANQHFQGALKWPVETWIASGLLKICIPELDISGSMAPRIYKHIN